MAVITIRIVVFDEKVLHRADAEGGNIGAPYNDHNFSDSSFVGTQFVDVKVPSNFLSQMIR